MPHSSSCFLRSRTSTASRRDTAIISGSASPSTTTVNRSHSCMPCRTRAPEKEGHRQVDLQHRGQAITSEVVADGHWVNLQGDILPHILAGLQEAWKRGYLPASQNLSDYRIGSLVMGWEIPDSMMPPSPSRTCAPPQPFLRPHPECCLPTEESLWVFGHRDSLLELQVDGRRPRKNDEAPARQPRISSRDHSIETRSNTAGLKGFSPPRGQVPPWRIRPIP